MVSEVLVHVGMHKTGTTALQRAMAGYDDGTTRHARLGDENHSIPFVTLYSQTPHRYHVWQAVSASPDQVARARARHRAMLDAELALPHRRLTVIGEEISLLPPAAITEMAADLTAQDRRLSLLAYLRDPLGYVTSAFQQQVRGGQSCFTLPRPHYRLRFAKFLALRGPVTLGFHAFTSQRFAATSIVTDFSRALNLPAAALADCRVNPALPLDALRLIHLLNRTAPPVRTASGQSARSALIRHLATSFSGRFALPADIAASAIDPDEVAWIEDISHIPLGPRFAATDPARAEIALSAMFAAIPPDALDRLRADLSLRGQTQTRQDDAASLILRLFQTFLADEQHRSTPPRSATA